MSQDMTKESDLVDLGDQAEALLKTETFTQTVNNLVEETFQQFVNTKPEQAQAREQTYNKYRALVEIVHTLQQRVTVRDEILAKSDNNGEEAP